jgi:prepilin-type N-terminal cleavage/methylation domain-containing protein
MECPATEQGAQNHYSDKATTYTASSEDKEIKRTMWWNYRRTDKGLTLTELLVVMLIIGLLSSVAIPVYINRMEDARVRMAMAECREIAMAEEQCALIHGYYVPFQVLDDLPHPRNLSLQGDTIRNEPDGQLFVINPLIRPELQQGNQIRLSATSNVPRVREMIDNWAGPFINYHRVYTGNQDPKDPNFINTTEVRLDFPLDPWGQPYRFYSPLGIIGTNALNTNITNLTYSFSDGALTSSDDRNFQRYAVVSYGRDGVPETLAGVNNRDDIIYFFGVTGVESQFGLRP